MTRSLLRHWNKKRLVSITAQHPIRSSASLCFHNNNNNNNSNKNKNELYKPMAASAAAVIETSTTQLDPNTTDASLPAIIAANESILTSIHGTGLPWWATIVASTVILRSSLTLPIAIYQQRSLSRMIQLAPMLESWQHTLRQKLLSEGKEIGWTHKQYEAELQKQYKKKVNHIYAENECPRWKVLLLPYMQIPLFISMSLTLRHLSAYPLPYFGKTADMPVVGLAEEGFGWVTDLTVSDPTLIVPVLIGAGNLINVELNAFYARGRMTTKQKIWTNAFRLLSVAFIPIAAQAPMAMGLYWMTSAWYSVVQNVAFKIPRVRSTLGMAPLVRKDVKKSETLE